MKKYSRSICLLFALSLCASGIAQTTSETKAASAHGFELDVTALCSMRLPAEYVVANGTSEQITFNYNVSPGLSMSAFYRIKVARNLSLVPGISCFFYQQSADVISRATFGGAYLYGGQIKMNSYGITLSAGVRWTLNKLHIENGLALMDILRRSGHVISPDVSPSEIPVKDSKPQPYVFLQSYHKVGADLSRLFSLYAGVYLIYGGKTTNAYSFLPISGVNLLPSVSCKFRF